MEPVVMALSLHIDEYSFGKIVVNGLAYTEDIKIVQGAVVPNWWRKSGHQVDIDDIEDVLGSPVTILVIGKGEPGLMQASSALREFLKINGIRLIEESTSRAVKVFNHLFQRGQSVSAGFHLTC